MARKKTKKTATKKTATTSRSKPKAEPVASSPSTIAAKPGEFYLRRPLSLITDYVHVTGTIDEMLYVDIVSITGNRAGLQEVTVRNHITHKQLDDRYMVSDKATYKNALQQAMTFIRAKQRQQW